jgi:hypothetical protein
MSRFAFRPPRHHGYNLGMKTILGLLFLIGFVVGMGLLAIGIVLDFAPGKTVLAKLLMRAGATLLIGTILFGGVLNALMNP